MSLQLHSKAALVGFGVLSFGSVDLFMTIPLSDLPCAARAGAIKDAAPDHECAESRWMGQGRKVD